MLGVHGTRHRCVIVPRDVIAATRGSPTKARARGPCAPGARHCCVIDVLNSVTTSCMLGTTCNRSCEWLLTCLTEVPYERASGWSPATAIKTSLCCMKGEILTDAVWFCVFFPVVSVQQKHLQVCDIYFSDCSCNLAIAAEFGKILCKCI